MTIGPARRVPRKNRKDYQYGKVMHSETDMQAKAGSKE